MRHKVYSIEDVKSNVFSQPFFFIAAGQALRAFKDLANDENTQVCKHADDFRLVQLAEFDDESGEFVSSGKVTLGFASEFKMAGAVPLGIVKGA